MIGKKLPTIFRIMLVIWVILQVCLVVKYWDMPNHDDALAYVNLASECLSPDSCFRYGGNGFVRDHFPLSLSLLVCDNNLCSSGS